MSISSGTFVIGVATSDYTTWEAFEADIAAVLTGAIIGEGKDEVFTINRFVLNGFATTVSNTLTLRAVAGAENLGVADAGCRIIGASGNGWGLIQAEGDVAHLIVENLNLANTSDLGDLFRIPSSNNGGVILKVRKTILQGSLSSYAGAGGGLRVNDWADIFSVDFENCIFIDTVLLGLSTDTAKVTMSYCTSLRSDNNISETGFRWVTVKNCTSMNWGPTSSHRDYLNLNGSSSNHAAHDSSGDPASLDNLVAADEFVQPETWPWDMQLKSGGALFHAGANISGITTDIAGNTRHATTPSIGAWETEVVGGGPTASLLLMQQSFRQ